MGYLTAFNLPDVIRGYRTTTFIESGTGWGEGLLHAAQFPFDQIVSIDIMPAAIERLRGRFADEPRVRLIAGRSVDVLAEILPHVQGNACFWLDGHFPGADMKLAAYDAEPDPGVRLPLEQELRLIKQLRPDAAARDVILIDDLRIYERDAFEWGNLDETGYADIAAYGNAGFLYALFADTHVPHRSLAHSGYLALMPKAAGRSYNPAVSIAIVDYGMANLRSVQKAFEHVGHRADIISRPEEIDRAEKLVLPGVGAFKDAVATLRQRELAAPILRHIERGRPFLGICLGLQMLFDTGYEDGVHAGLGLLRGTCIRFDVDQTMNLKVPHMGWNQLRIERPSPLVRDLPPDANVYFVHGYHVVPANGDASVIATTTDYGRPFVSSIWRDNVMATQFHPEKSQRVGLKILENFAVL